MNLYESIVERWFEDLFTRDGLSTVEGLVTADFAAYGTGGDGRTIESRGLVLSRSGFVGTSPPLPTVSGPPSNFREHSSTTLVNKGKKRQGTH